ncbi:CAP domain-containing protein [Haematococcus lacustris]
MRPSAALGWACVVLLGLGATGERRLLHNTRSLTQSNAASAFSQAQAGNGYNWPPLPQWVTSTTDLTTFIGQQQQAIRQQMQQQFQLLQRQMEAALKQQQGSSQPQPQSSQQQSPPGASLPSSSVTQPSTRQDSNNSQGGNSNQGVTTQPQTSPPPPSTVAVSTPKAASPEQNSASSSLQSVALSMHNDLRYRHQAAPLSWSPSLAADSKSWADGCVWGHSKAPNQGENLAMGFPDAKSAIQAWADEETQYIYGELTPSNFEEVGHFTQMVWQGTTSVGCALTSCGYSKGGDYLVCRYAPPGNVVDNFVKNVAPARRST